MNRKSLLEETIEMINDYGHTIEEIEFVTDGQFSYSWYEFTQEAKFYYYDSGFGSCEVNVNLKIVGKDWWLERNEYDGSEWWEHKQKPKMMPLAHEKIKL